jgi:hypothetical protein
MKVVYNTKGFGLRLNDAEMRMFCALLGYTLCTHPNPLSSDTTWFSGVDWEEFRAEPLLVRLVEEGMLSNEDLAIHEVEDGTAWGIGTYYMAYEFVEEYEAWYDEHDWDNEDETEGEPA